MRSIVIARVMQADLKKEAHLVSLNALLREQATPLKHVRRWRAWCDCV
jgi:hypothetical protein